MMNMEASNFQGERARINPRRSKLKCPKFDGYNFLGWKLKVERFFETVIMAEEDKVQIAMIHLKGKALQWHQCFMKSRGSLRKVSWMTYVKEMRICFNDNEFANPMSKLVSLKQSASVKEYYEEFKALLNHLQLTNEYTLSIFVSNLKLEIAKSVKLFYLKFLTHAFNLAKQVESMIYNLPQKPFVPYKNALVVQPLTL